MDFSLEKGGKSTPKSTAIFNQNLGVSRQNPHNFQGRFVDSWRTSHFAYHLSFWIVIFFFSLTTPPPFSRQTPPVPHPRESLQNGQFGPFWSVSVQFGPFRASSGESWGAGWGRGGVWERGFCKGVL